MQILRRIYARLLLLFFVLALLVGHAVAQAAPAAAECHELRVMTFNIRYGSAPDGENHWSKRRQMVFDLIARNRPDVVGLQEALRFQIVEILAAAPGYETFGVGREDGKQLGEHSAVLYRTERLAVLEQGDFWFSDTPEVPGSKTWGNQITRVCSWARFKDQVSGKGFYLYNLHLDHISQPSREKSAVLLMERVSRRSTGEPVILTGDFNSGESNPALRYVKGEAAIERAPPSQVAFRDTFRVLYPDATEVGTFHAFKGTRSGDKIDHILISPSIEVREAAILRDEEAGRYPSDHFLVTATLCLP